jgi:hypothetical protein
MGNRSNQSSNPGGYIVGPVLSQKAGNSILTAELSGESSILGRLK